jgi:hypothetical protein
VGARGRQGAPGHYYRTLLGELKASGDLVDEQALTGPEQAKLPGHHRLDAVRAHLYELAGDLDRAVAHYEAAASRTTSRPEQEYLIIRIIRAAGVRRRRRSG